MCKGQGSLAHECNEGVALVHVQGARVACPRRHTAGKGHFSRNSKGDRARVPAPGAGTLAVSPLELTFAAINTGV